jgi:hypothetical protein
MSYRQIQRLVQVSVIFKAVINSLVLILMYLDILYNSNEVSTPNFNRPTNVAVSSSVPSELSNDGSIWRYFLVE